MTVATTPASDPAERRALVDRSRRRGDRIFRRTTVVAASMVLLLLGLMVLGTAISSRSVFQSQGLFGFLLGMRWVPTEGIYGALPFIYGTLVTAVIAVVVGVPIAVLIALYLSEIAPRKVARRVSYVVDLLAAIPSVVYALWGVFVFVPYVLRPVQSFLARYLGWSKIFEGPVFGLSYLSVGLVLSIMIVPIVSAICREVFATVPPGEREAALALGATRWEMIRLAVLPRSRPGIIGAVMLGLGRALGETIVAAVLIGSQVDIHASVLQPGYTMAAVIANQFAEADATQVRALMGLGVVLFFITILVNVVARLIVARTSRVGGRRR
jgi:phosphate transport system permease protein